MLVTVSTKGVDWPYGVEALHVAGTPCFLRRISFSSAPLHCA